jgi:hypothetical protein
MSQLLFMLKHWQNYDVPKKTKQNKQTTQGETQKEMKRQKKKDTEKEDKT